MDADAVKHIIEYAEAHDISVRVTRQNRPKPSTWTVDFLNHVDAEICQADLQHYGVKFDHLDSGTPWRLI